MRQIRISQGHRGCTLSATFVSSLKACEIEANSWYKHINPRVWGGPIAIVSNGEKRLSFSSNAGVSPCSNSVERYLGKCKAFCLSEFLANKAATIGAASRENCVWGAEYGLCPFIYLRPGSSPFRDKTEGLGGFSPRACKSPYNILLCEFHYLLKYCYLSWQGQIK